MQTMLNVNIKNRRHALGYTLQQVGDAVGVSRTTIQRYESGEIENIDSRMIMKLADFLQTTPSALVGWEKPSTTGNKKLDELFTLCIQMNDKQLQGVLDIVYAVINNFSNS